MRIALIVGVVIVVVGCKYEKRDLTTGSGSGSSSPAEPAPPDDGWIVDQLPGDHPEVLALAGSSSTDVWAVGRNLLAHYDGKTWSDAAPPASRCASCTLSSISVAAPDDVWAVGDDGMVAHFDGKAWTITQPDIFLDRERGGYEHLSHVVAWHRGGAIVSVKYGNQLVRFDGTSWSKMPSPPHDLAAAWWGVAPDDLWVWDSISSDRWHGAMRHFDGTAWGPEVRFGDSGVLMERMKGTSRSDIWLVGRGGARTGYAVAYHFDGKTWTEATFPTNTPGLSTLDVAGPNEAYAGARDTLLAWNGTAWQRIPSPAALSGSLDKVYAPGGGHLFVAAWDDGRVAHQK